MTTGFQLSYGILYLFAKDYLQNDTETSKYRCPFPLHTFLKHSNTQRQNRSPYNGNGHRDESILYMLDSQKIQHNHKYFSLYSTLPFRVSLASTLHGRIYISKAFIHQKNDTQRAEKIGEFSLSSYCKHLLHPFILFRGPIIKCCLIQTLS